MSLKTTSTPVACARRECESGCWWGLARTLTCVLINLLKNTDVRLNQSFEDADVHLNQSTGSENDQHLNTDYRQ